MISNGKARRIASEWHGEQSSPLYSFASTGTISQPYLDREMTQCGQMMNDHPENYTDEHRAEFTELDTYILNHGERGPVAGWSAGWE